MQTSALFAAQQMSAGVCSDFFHHKKAAYIHNPMDLLQKYYWQG
jgi:hypothetical protein